MAESFCSVAETEAFPESKYGKLSDPHQTLDSHRRAIYTGSFFYVSIGAFLSLWLSANLLLNRDKEYTYNNKVCLVSLAVTAFVGSLLYISFCLLVVRRPPSKLIVFLKFCSKWMSFFYVVLLGMGVLTYFFSSSIYDIVSHVIILCGGYMSCWIIFHMMAIKPFVKETKKILRSYETV